MIDFLYVFLGFTTSIIFIFKIEWLFSLRNYLLLLSFGIVLFLISKYLLVHQISNQKTVPLLQVCFYATLIFGLFYFIFKKVFHRNPVNTFWVYSRKPIEDVLFNFIFWLAGSLTEILR